MSTSPHDALFKGSFGRPELAASELRLVLPPAVVARLDLATLTPVSVSLIDTELRHVEADLIYSVRTSEGTEAFVFVLMEHQSSFDAMMPFRLLRYIVRLWEQWRREHPEARRLPLVLPVVMHHSEEGWRASPELSSVLDASEEMLEATRAYVPHFRFALDDLSAQGIEALATRPLHAQGRLIQLAFWSSRSPGRLLEAVPWMKEVAAQVEDDASTGELWRMFCRYLLVTGDMAASEVQTILLEIAGPTRQEIVMSAATQLIEQGIEQGRAKERMEILGKLLTLKFGPLSEAVHGRLQAAHVDELARWTERVLTASSLDEALG